MWISFNRLLLHFGPFCPTTGMDDQLEALAGQELEIEQLERLLANLSDEAVLTQEEVRSQSAKGQYNRLKHNVVNS